MQLVSPGEGIPERFIEVDAARLLLILCQFARPVDTHPADLAAPPVPIVGHFTPEYLLQKLDFLLRYPRYFICELLELYKQGVVPTSEREALIQTISQILAVEEPDLHTLAYRRFWRGAHENLDLVESWWTSRRLVFVRFQRRGAAPPQKHYLLTEEARHVARQLKAAIVHAAWYGERISLLHRYFGELRPLELGRLQYQHPQYRDADIGSSIPDLTDSDVDSACVQILGPNWKTKP